MVQDDDVLADVRVSVLTFSGGSTACTGVVVRFAGFTLVKLTVESPRLESRAHQGLQAYVVVRRP